MRAVSYGGPDDFVKRDVSKAEFTEFFDGVLADIVGGGGAASEAAQGRKKVWLDVCGHDRDVLSFVAAQLGLDVSVLDDSHVSSSSGGLVWEWGVGSG